MLHCRLGENAGWVRLILIHVAARIRLPVRVTGKLGFSADRERARACTYKCYGDLRDHDTGADSLLHLIGYV